MTGDQAQKLIDLERYPIERLDDDGAQELIGRCQADLRATGACVLEGFVPSTVLSAVIEEVSPHLGDAHYKIKHHNSLSDRR